MPWSKENLEKFIELYRNSPCLWKIKCNEYKNRNLKNRAYDRMVEFCKRAVCPEANKELVIRKIQGIRGCFRKELKKINDTKRSGCSEEDVHKPNLWYFDLLLFTKDQEEPMDSICNTNSDTDESNSENISQFEVPVEAIWSLDRKKEKETNTTEETTHKYGHIVKRKEVFPSPKVSRKKAKLLQTNMKFMNVWQRALERSNIETTEYEAVGINVGKKLEKMDDSQAAYAEMLINTILHRGLFNRLTPNTIVCENSQSDNSTRTNNSSLK